VRRVNALFDSGPVPDVVDACVAEAIDARAGVPRAEWTDGYALSADGSNFLSAMARRLRWQRVLEFGSGDSTVVLARALASIAGRSDRIRLMSFENVAGVSDDVRRRLCADALDTFVDLRVAPVRLRAVAGRLSYFYAFPASLLVSLAPLDAVFVDGPPDYLGRQASLPLCLQYVRPGGFVILDDADRATELQWLEEWKAMYGRAISIWVLDGLERPMGVVRIDQPHALPRLSPRSMAVDVVRFAKAVRARGVSGAITPQLRPFQSAPGGVRRCESE
jgi:predicted O-methyltransferase YrrM